MVRAALRSPGRPLDPDVRAEAEARLHHDFGRVRVHAGELADRSARALDAAAYTQGEDIAFRAGRYAPSTAAGRALLEHELQHVVEQRSGLAPAGAIQRAPADGSGAVEDDETKLGKELWASWPNGVNVAFYGEEHDPATKHFADHWAIREQALGPKGRTISAKTLAFGRSISDKMGFEKTMTAMSAVLVSAAAKGAPSTPPPAGTPAKFKTVAIFSHGWSTGVHFAGGDFRNTNAAEKVKKVAPALTQDVNVILYACSAAKAPSEEESWYSGTMKGGGQGSLAGEMRDALISEGLTGGTVWGHTTVGTASSNWALRRFSAAAGAGAAGESYVSTDIFTAVERASAIADLQGLIAEQGLEISDPEKFTAAAQAALTGAMYDAYRQATRLFRHRDTTLGEAAPVDPSGVATIVRDHWNDTFWPAAKAKTAAALIKKLKLKKPK